MKREGSGRHDGVGATGGFAPEVGSAVHGKARTLRKEMEMANERMSVDELLREQAHSGLQATVEAVEGKPERVRVTPWTPGGGCLCQLALVIARAALDSVTPTGEVHVCCGKRLKVVEVHFREGQTMTIEEVFGQLRASADTEAEGGGGRAEPMRVIGDVPAPTPPWGPGPPPWERCRGGRLAGV